MKNMSSVNQYTVKCEKHGDITNKFLYLNYSEQGKRHINIYCAECLKDLKNMPSIELSTGYVPPG